jgi:hypothetical protein
MQLRVWQYDERAFNRQMGVIWLLLVRSRALNREKEYWILVPINSRVALPNGLLDNSTAARPGAERHTSWSFAAHEAA